MIFILVALVGGAKVLIIIESVIEIVRNHLREEGNGLKARTVCHHREGPGRVRQRR